MKTIVSKNAWNQAKQSRLGWCRECKGFTAPNTDPKSTTSICGLCGGRGYGAEVAVDLMLIEVKR